MGTITSEDGDRQTVTSEEIEPLSKTKQETRSQKQKVVDL